MNFYNQNLFIIIVILIVIIYNILNVFRSEEYIKQLINKQDKLFNQLKKKKDITKEYKNLLKTNKKIESMDGSEELVYRTPKVKEYPEYTREREDPEREYPKYIIEREPREPREDPVYTRDNMVLNNKLYPPLGRTERPTFDLLMKQVNDQSGVFNMYTRGMPDTFRPVGYLTLKNGDQTIDSTLILYGRSKYPGSDQGEFYVTSSNKMSDIKVPLTEYNTNVKRITDIPNDVNIRGNLLNGEYNFTELPKADLSYPYI
jgi:hypothetical protein